MVLCRLSFLVLFIPIAIGINETATKGASAHNITDSVPKKLLKKDDNNSTRKTFTLAAEGGDIQVLQSNSKLIMENDAVQLPKLPSGDFGEVSTKTKGKHVVARTGAPVIDLKDSLIKAPETIESKDVSSKAPVSIQKSTIINKLTASSSSVRPPSTSKIPHKPTVLRYEEGSRIVSDKIPPGISEATQASKYASHPGMIMPVVITILVVPLFAVLGYMALKKGKEAWKNRHYKRMDFLLDGMYND